MRASPDRSRGFTLVEAMIVMAIAAILLAAVGPSFADFTRNQRIRAVAYDLVADLLLARSEAIMRGSPVTVVGLGAGWAGGWTIRVDGGLHAGNVVQRRDAPGEGVSVGGAALLTFDRNGRLIGGGTARVAISDRVAGEVKRCIEIDLSGMPRSRSGACA